MSTVGNLGDYQKMTTLAKQVGGPWGLAVAVAGMGAVAGYPVLRIAEKTITRKVASNLADKAGSSLGGTECTATSSGIDDSGLELREGESFTVLDLVPGGALIEVHGRDDNPFTVSAAFISSVSDYPA